jgi:hypothetical protein
VKKVLGSRNTASAKPTDDLKQDLGCIMLLFVTADDLKQDLPQKML